MIPPSKVIHLAWTFKGPELLLLARRNWPGKLQPSEGWYHDFPTGIIAGVSLLRIVTRNSQRLPFFQVGVGHILLSSCAGFLWHGLSVYTLARRIPEYRFHLLSRSRIFLTLSVAASEELIWREDRGAASILLSSIGFGLTHFRIGSVFGAIHMGVFALISRFLEREYGLLCSIVFHSAYNIAFESESAGRGR